MNQLYFMEIGSSINNSMLDDMAQCLPQEKKERVLRYRQDIDKKIRIYSEIFIRYLISMKSGARYNEINIKTSQTGKPYLEGIPLCEFNISHTKNAVAVALSDMLIGVDVERVRDIDLHIADRVFSDGELALLYSKEEDRNLRFFDIWTKKEALAKHDGKGLTGDLKSLDVTSCSHHVNFVTVMTGDYIISSCSAAAFQERDYFKITEPEFIEIWRNHIN